MAGLDVLINLLVILLMAIIKKTHRPKILFIGMPLILASILFAKPELYIWQIGYLELIINYAGIFAKPLLLVYCLNLLLVTSLAVSDNDWHSIWLGLGQMIAITISVTGGNVITRIIGIELASLCGVMAMALSSDNSLHRTVIKKLALIYAAAEFGAGVISLIGALILDGNPASIFGHNLLAAGLVMHLGGGALLMIIPRCYTAIYPLARMLIAPVTSKLCLVILAVNYSGTSWLMFIAISMWLYGLIYATTSKQPVSITTNYQLVSTGLVLISIASPLANSAPAILNIISMIIVQIILLIILYFILYAQDRGSTSRKIAINKYTSHIISRISSKLLQLKEEGVGHDYSSERKKPAKLVYKWQARLMQLILIIAMANVAALPGSSYYYFKHYLHDIASNPGWFDDIGSWVGKIATVYYLINFYRAIDINSLARRKLSSLSLGIVSLLAVALAVPSLLRLVINLWEPITISAAANMLKPAIDMWAMILLYYLLRQSRPLNCHLPDLLDLYLIIARAGLKLGQSINRLAATTSCYIASYLLSFSRQLWCYSDEYLHHNGVASTKLIGLVLVMLSILGYALLHGF